MTCRCEEFTAEFRYCDEHHAYLNGTTRLESVTRVIGSLIPYEPKDPAAAENARDRGAEVDLLFSSWLLGEIDKIPPGTRTDSFALFNRLVIWWLSQKRGTPQVQQIVHDACIAGRYDLKVDGVRYDVKCTYNVSPLAAIQLAAYEELDDEKCDALKVLHVTERFKTVKVVDIDKKQATEDWMTVRRAWKLQRRLAEKK